MRTGKIEKSICWPLLLALTVLLGVAGCAHQPVQQPMEVQVAPSAGPPSLEPKAIDILKASSSRLASAHSMKFTAVVSYESPSRFGPTLVYTTTSDVTLQRPNKLKVVTPGDGPASEFYYDGKTMEAFSPAENLIAIAEAPPIIDAALEAAYHTAAIYFPFTDLIVTDPYTDIADGLRVAFYIGQSSVVGETTTNMVAYGNDDVFIQTWIGAEDKLPRRARAIYLNDPLQLRHDMVLLNWQLDPVLPVDAFKAPSISGAKRIPFANPEAWTPQGVKPQGEPSKAE